MKNKLTIVFFYILCSQWINAQSSKVVPISTTKNITVTGSANVIIYKSDSLKAIIKGENDEINMINIQPSGDGITINGGSYKYDTRMVVEIYTNNIENISVSGSGDVEMKDAFTTQNFNLTASGAGDFKGNVECASANISGSGTADIKITGRANEANVMSSGTSDIKLIDFATEKMTITASGAGDAYVNVSKDLNATATGASDIYYMGTPEKLVVNTNGASDIRPYGGKNNYTNDYNYHYNYNYSYDGDSTQVKKKKGKFFNNHRDMFGGGKYRQDLVWMGIDLGVDGLADLTNGFDLQPQGDYNFMEMNYWRNTHVRVNFFEWRFNLVDNVFNIVTGMGWDFQHYAFAQKIRFDEANDYPGQGYTTPVVGATDTLHSINRSRLAVQYFQIPLFLNLRTKKTAKHRQQFNFTFGVVGGIKTGASSRIIYTENGMDVEEEKKDDFNLEVFTATAMVRIKYSFFSIYASYQFTPMFRGQNPNLYPFTLGVTLLSW